MRTIGATINRGSVVLQGANSRSSRRPSARYGRRSSVTTSAARGHCVAAMTAARPRIPLQANECGSAGESPRRLETRNTAQASGRLSPGELRVGRVSLGRDLNRRRRRDPWVESVQLRIPVDCRLPAVLERGSSGGLRHRISRSGCLFELAKRVSKRLRVALDEYTAPSVDNHGDRSDFGREHPVHPLPLLRKLRGKMTRTRWAAQRRSAAA